MAAMPTTGWWPIGSRAKSPRWSWASSTWCLQRTKDGYFAGSNFPVDPQLLSEETSFDAKDLGGSPLARRTRWDQLMGENKGRIDVNLARRFLGDAYDAIDRKTQPSERTICGRNDLSTRGMKPWQMEFGPAGAVQNKVADATSMEQMSLWLIFDS